MPNREDIGIAVQELQTEARRLGLVWDLRPATITDDRNMIGVIDGDEDVATELLSLIGRPVTGTRVMVMAVPPSGNYVVGYASRNQLAVGQSTIRRVVEDISVTSDITPDDHVFAIFEDLPMAAEFKIFGWLWWTSTSGTPDIRTQIEGATDAVGETSFFAQGTGATVAEGSINTGVASPLATNHVRGSLNGALSGLLVGWYNTVAEINDLKFEVAQGTSSGTAVVLKKGSWVELTRMA